MPRRCRRATAWVLVAMAAAAAPSSPQTRAGGRSWETSSREPALALAAPWRAEGPMADLRSAAVPYAPAVGQLASGPSPTTVTLLSLGLPGAGQHLLGQRRKWLYVALEAVGWTLFLERRGAAGRYRERYRDFAWENARFQSGARIDGDFDYYETLTKWTRSGAFDSDEAAPGVQPEPDAGTFNGSVWALALQIYLQGGGSAQEADPGYQNALAYYQERAYGPTFLWDWSGASDGPGELARLIEASDDRFRQATTVLGAVLANHLIAAVDAYASARGLPGAAGLRVEPSVQADGGRWRAVWSLTVR